VLLRTDKDSRLLQPELQLMRDAGVAFTELNAEGVRKIETAVNPDAVF
jgi:D-amino-acid dehydrogenase